jgi:hypothetical protein
VADQTDTLSPVTSKPASRGLESTPAIPRCLIGIRLLDPTKGLFNPWYELGVFRDYLSYIGWPEMGPQNFNDGPTDAFQWVNTTIDGGISKGILTNALAYPPVGYFYFSRGHGDPANLSPDKSWTDILSTRNIQVLLGNRQILSYQHPPYLLRIANAHPYGLVMLAVCNTASYQWARAFGIDYPVTRPNVWVCARNQNILRVREHFKKSERDRIGKGTRKAREGVA